MSKSRTLIGTAAAVALALGALAAPASAEPPSDAKLVIGHGIPKAVVDVCVKDLDGGGGQIEAISNFKFGSTVKTSLPAGNWRFITRAAKSGNCNGKKLITADVMLYGGDDLSVIATKTAGTPTYQVFNNLEFFECAACVEGPAFIGTYLSVKHAAMIGKADVWVTETLVASTPAPTLSGVPKGAQATEGVPPSPYRVAVGKTGKDPLRETPFWQMKAGKVSHVVAIGGPKNFRFLRYRTDAPTNGLH